MTKTGIYIHIPFCRAKCDYCGFYSLPEDGTLRNGLVPRYVAALVGEIERRNGPAGDGVDTVFFGGGSPSYLEPDQLAPVFDALRRSFTIDADAEITVEINPSDLGRGIIPFLADSGVNRFSMGVQTLNPELYARIGRKGGFCTAELLDRYFSIPGVQHCVDIIGGLPGQTPEMLRDELDAILGYRPDHVSLYMLTLEEGSLLERRFRPDEGFDHAQREALAEGISVLKSRGYEHYEVSNFALPGRRSRHNMKYWNFEPYIGFGAGAHSFIGGERTANPSDVAAYIGGAPAVRDEKDSPGTRMAEFLMTSLRLREGFSTARFEQLFDQALPSDVEKRVHELSQKGSVLVRREGDFLRIAVSDGSFFFSDSVIFTMVEPLL